MPRLICLQSGHEGVTSGATGAPGEQELNKRIRDRLSQVLQSKGFVIQVVNANPPYSEINKDFDLFLALHGDANVYGKGGGFCDFPDPSVDMVSAESKRIRDVVTSVYFPETGIVSCPERSNANTKFYYMWSRLSAKTPCVILEMGVVQDAHDKVILADTERVVAGIAKGICKAFGVPYEQTVPPEEMVTIPKTELAAYKASILALSGANDKLRAEMALKDKECQDKIEAYRKSVKTKLTDLASSI